MYHFIINPNAGSGRGWKVWRAIAGYMDRHNIEYEAVLTNGIGEARDAARELTKEAGKPCFLIVVGGDGTMNEVLDGASFHGPLNVGYIPAGTGNDLWKSAHAGKPGEVPEKAASAKTFFHDRLWCPFLWKRRTFSQTFLSQCRDRL